MTIPPGGTLGVQNATVLVQLVQDVKKRLQVFDCGVEFVVNLSETGGVGGDVFGELFRQMEFERSENVLGFVEIDSDVEPVVAAPFI
jgi:hypothetical protein